MNNLKNNLLLEEMIEGISLSGLVKKESGIYALEKSIENSGEFIGNLCPSGYPVIMSLLLKTNAAPKIRTLFKRFNSQVVLDLGAGNDSKFYNSVSDFDINGYIGVELFHEERLLDGLRNSFNSKKIPFAVVREDMLNFLKRIPDNSVSVHISGIDEIIIPDISYHKKVIQEISRVLHPRGVYTESQGIEIGGFDAEKLGLKKIIAECDVHGYIKN